MLPQRVYLKETISITPHLSLLPEEAEKSGGTWILVEGAVWKEGPLSSPLHKYSECLNCLSHSLTGGSVMVSCLKIAKTSRALNDSRTRRESQERGGGTRRRVGAGQPA